MVARPEFSNAHDFNDEFAKEGPDVKNRARSSQIRKRRAQVQRAHRDAFRHADLMLGPGRNPKAEMRRDDPQTMARSHLHKATARVKQLISTVRLLPHMPTT